MAYLQKRGNSYRITISCDTGRRTMTFKCNPSLTEKQNLKQAQKAAALFETDNKKNGANPNTRLADFIETWRTDYAINNLKPKVLADYEQLLPRIIQALGRMKLVDIKPKTLNDFFNTLSNKGIGSRYSYQPKEITLDCIKEYKASGGTYSELAAEAGLSLSTLESVRKSNPIEKDKAEGLCYVLRLNMEDAFTKKVIRRKLSNSTIQHFHRLLSSILGKAVRWEYIDRNPAVYCTPPKVERGRKQLPDYHQAIALADCLETEDIKHKTMTLLLLYSGMRKGELLGLEWKDIDFDNCSISIERASQYISIKAL